MDLPRVRLDGGPTNRALRNWPDAALPEEPENEYEKENCVTTLSPEPAPSEDTVSLRDDTQNIPSNSSGKY